MPRKSKPKEPPKRNIIARDAQRQPSAGPMKDKRKLSRQQQRIEDARKAAEARNQESGSKD